VATIKGFLTQSILHQVTILILASLVLVIHGLAPLSPAAVILSIFLMVVVIADPIVGATQTAYPKIYLKKQAVSIAIGLVGILLLWGLGILRFIGASILIIRGLVLLIRSISSIQGFDSFTKNLTLRPAQTLALSFGLVILTGTFYLMLPMATVASGSLRFLDALFTATSAVCVTGLIVLDTAKDFTFWGQLGILVLIQIGGLGIMVFTYSAVFGLRQKIRLEDKLLVSYMMNESDFSRLSQGLKSMISFTLGIELVGATILTLGFLSHGGTFPQALWKGIFHSISAFCNAGFALFSNSLEQFVADPLISLTISGLIILGGLSFPVMMNIRDSFINRDNHRVQLSLNTRVVLWTTSILLVSGLLVFYGLEYRGSMAHLPIGTQYLAAFFQSVTLRTAGFNTLDFSLFSDSITLVMLGFMFIGGASGSTAGGIKVNTAGVLVTTLYSRFRGKKQVLIGKEAIQTSTANNSLFLFFYGILVVSLGLFVLTISESLAFLDLMFETVSAFATVGLSRGITPQLSSVGRSIIIVLMFIGRVGPMTILTALGANKRDDGVVYPEKELLIG
jgi:trk system potassium uptake protein TrkH